jgi:hypothetical protein
MQFCRIRDDYGKEVWDLHVDDSSSSSSIVTDSSILVQIENFENFAACNIHKVYSMAPTRKVVFLGGDILRFPVLPKW